MNRKSLNLNLAWTLFLATLLYCGAAAAVDPRPALAAANGACLAHYCLPIVPADGQPTP